MSDKRILVVDDDNFILTFIEHTLKKLEPSYQVTTVINGPTALEQIQQHYFDLVITDYMMPGISGVDLATAIRYVAPKTRVILMTAYATDQLRHTIELLHVDGYLRKPLNLTQIRKVIQDTIGDKKDEKSPTAMPESLIERDVNKHLQALYVNTGARYVMLVSGQGHPVQVVGPVGKDESVKIATLVAANFLAANKLVELLGSSAAYKSSSFEGTDQVIYTYNIDGQFLLAVVFGKETKSGLVSVYTKQTSDALTPLVSQFSLEEFSHNINLTLNIQRSNGKEK